MRRHILHSAQCIVRRACGSRQFDSDQLSRSVFHLGLDSIRGIVTPKTPLSTSTLPILDALSGERDRQCPLSHRSSLPSPRHVNVLHRTIVERETFDHGERWIHWSSLRCQIPQKEIEIDEENADNAMSSRLKGAVQDSKATITGVTGETSRHRNHASTAKQAREMRAVNTAIAVNSVIFLAKVGTWMLTSSGMKRANIVLVFCINSDNIVVCFVWTLSLLPSLRQIFQCLTSLKYIFFMIMTKNLQVRCLLSLCIHLLIS